MTWAALVLAAGHSRRMGQENKLTLEWRGKALVAHAVDALLEAGADPVVVVTGHEPERVRAALGSRAITYQHNDAHAQGMGTSLARGARALEAPSRVAVCLGDMPSIRPETLRLLAASPGVIVAPTHRGRRGHPVFFDGALLEELRSLGGDQGARALVGAHGAQLVEVDDPGVLLDVDTPQAWAALKK